MSNVIGLGRISGKSIPDQLYGIKKRFSFWLSLLLEGLPQPLFPAL